MPPGGRTPVYLLYIGDKDEAFQNKILNAKVIVTNIIAQDIPCALQLLIILHSSSKMFTPIAKLLHYKLVPEQKLLR